MAADDVSRTVNDNGVGPAELPQARLQLAQLSEGVPPGISEIRSELVDRAEFDREIARRETTKVQYFGHLPSFARIAVGKSPWWKTSIGIWFAPVCPVRSG